MYNEMDPGSTDLNFLKTANAAVYGAMTAADPRSIYMMQAWLFHSGFWSYDRVQAYLSGVPIGHMIILDLNTEAGPVYKEYDGFFGHTWIWNALITYGGRRGIYGDLDVISTLPYTDKAGASNMEGVGFTPEATEMIPSQFDLIMEAGWRTQAFNGSQWLQDWAARRYGYATASGGSPSLSSAYAILEGAAYNHDIDEASLEVTPTVGDSMSHNTDADGILAALRLFVAAAQNKEIDPSLGPYSYDLTDLHRQVLVNIFSDAHAVTGARFDDVMIYGGAAERGARRLTSLGRGASVHTSLDARETRQRRTLAQSGGARAMRAFADAQREAQTSFVAGADDRSYRDAASAARLLASNTNNGTASVVALTAFLDGIFTDLDTQLAADPNFLLGRWINDAIAYGDSGSSPDEVALYAFGARNQVTLWGDRGEIRDYAAKNGWSGLVEGFYRGRYDVLLGAMVQAAATQTPLNYTAVSDGTFAFELSWGLQNNTNVPSNQASGADPVALAQATLAKYATFDPRKWRALPNTDVTRPAPPKPAQFVQVSPANFAATGADCPFLSEHDQLNTLALCEQGCANDGQCTDINFNPSGPYCVFRQCQDPLHPTLQSLDGWTVYGMNITAGPVLTTAWHKDLGVLSTLCAADPQGGCAAFSSNGYLYVDASTTVAAPGVTLYIPVPAE
jgi:hypothetical protein